MITIKIIALWFLYTSLCFWLARCGLGKLFNEDRGINTFFVLLSQGIGAALVYALHM